MATTSAPSAVRTGSQTVVLPAPTTTAGGTATTSAAAPAAAVGPATSGTVVLTLQPPASADRVRWSEDVVDNEHLNKKKSKRTQFRCRLKVLLGQCAKVAQWRCPAWALWRPAGCCIYHRPRPFGESDSEQDTTSSEDETDGLNAYENIKRKGARRRQRTC